MSRTKVIIGVIAVVIVGLMVGAFFATHEQVKREVREPPSGEARKNPYLALERLYGEMGVETKTVQTAAEPDDRQSLIVLTDRMHDFSPAQIKEWRSWVERGGHLVVAAPVATEVHAPLMEAFSFEPVEYGEESGSGESGSGDSGSGESGSGELESGESGSGELEIEGFANRYSEETTEAFEAEIGGGLLLPWSDDAIDWAATTEGGGERLLAVSKPHELGRVTLIADPDLWRNESIGEARHASFAWEIVGLTEADRREGPRRAQIVRFSARKSWIGYVAAQVWPFLVALGAMIGLALWSGRRRFGPLVPEEGDRSRSRTEHIGAMSKFAWKNGAADRLLEATREALLEELARKRPRLKDAPPDRQREMVAEMLELDEHDLALLFDGGEEVSRATFVQKIELMERYRRST